MNIAEKNFHALFDPRSIAFIGASNSPGKWGCIVLKNLVNGGYAKPIYPINPKEKEVLGLTSWENVKDLPETPDLAVIVIPPPAVPQAVQDCVDKGIRAGLVITAGFAEVGTDGQTLQQEMVRIAQNGNMLLVGPNCNGILRPSKRLFPQMPAVFPEAGPISVVSQSGNVATSLSQRANKTGFGVSCVVSSGNEADLHCEDFFQFLADDPQTRVIISYIEGFRNGRRFFDMAGRVTAKKPLVMLKAGATDAGARAAMSHTASLAGSDAVFAGACRQSGIIRVESLEELFNIGAGLLNQPVPRGSKTAVVTMGGGWGVLAADAAARYGLDVVRLSGHTLSLLDKILPSWWNPGNPVDMVAGNIEGALMKSLEILLEAPETDAVVLLGILGFLKIRPMRPDADPEVIENHIRNSLDQLSSAFDHVREMSFRYGKPVISATEIPFAVGDMEERIFYMLGQKKIAIYRTPEAAVKVLSHLVAYGKYVNR